MPGKRITIAGMAGRKTTIGVSQSGRDGASATVYGITATIAPTMGSISATETPLDALSEAALSTDNYVPSTGRTVSTVVFEGSTDGATWNRDENADLTAVARIYGRIIVTDDVGAATIFDLGSVQPRAVVDTLPMLTGDGTPQVGETITGTAATFIGANAAPVVTTLRRGGVIIATDPSFPYTLTDDDAGQTLTLVSVPNLGSSATSPGLDVEAPAGGEIVTVHSDTVLAQGVAELAPTLSGASITRIIDQPSRGWMTPRDDNKISYLLVEDTDRTGGSASATFEVDRNGDLETHQLNITISGLDPNEGRIPLSWPVFPTFYAEVDAGTGRMSFEPGPGHATIHTTLDSGAWWTRADIEAVEGGTANDSWLDAQDRTGDYYGSEAKPLEPGVAASWWDFRVYQKTSSTWLSFERGTNYDYEPFRPRGSWFPDSFGQSALHPIMVTSHGTGDLPKIGSMFPSNASANCVYQDCEGTSYGHGRGQPRVDNVMWDGCFFPNFYTTGAPENMTGVTFRRCIWLDCWDPTVLADYGSGHSTRQNPFHPYETRGTIVEKCIMDRAGYKPGWHYQGFGLADPPENYSHTNYSDEDSDDTLFSEVLSSRGAFGGYNVRGGGVILNSMAFDCNVGLTHGKSGNLGNQCRLAVSRLVITSAGWRVYDKGYNPSFAAGFIMSGSALAPTLDKVIVANYRNPAEGVEPVHDGPDPLGGQVPSYFLTKDGPGALAAGYNAAIKNAATINPDGTPGYTDYKVWNYPKDAVENVDGLNTTVLNETTMQKWLETKTGTPNQTTVTVAQYFRDTTNSYDLIREAVEWFCDRFGYGTIPSTPGTMRYRASAKSNGLRMDEPFNWTLDRPPMAGDTLHMNGHIKVRPRRNIYCDTLHMEDAQIIVDGLIDVSAAVSGPGTFDIEAGRVGQLRLPGYAGQERLTINVAGGRLLNTGAMTGTVDVTATGGETVLATPTASWTQAAGTTLRAEGSGMNDAGAGIGADGGAGTAALSFAAGSTLHLVGDAGGLPTLRKFQSGRYGNAAPACTFDVDCGGAALTLDLTGVPAGTYTIVDADSVSGTFAAPTLIGGSASVGYTAAAVTVTVS